MKINFPFLVIFLSLSMKAISAPAGNFQLMIAPGTLTDHELTLLWNKQPGKNSLRYEVVLRRDGSDNITNLRIRIGGPIPDGGKKLGNDMMASRGISVKKRFILNRHARNISISHLTLIDPHCLKLHYLNSDTIRVNNLKIYTCGLFQVRQVLINLKLQRLMKA